MTSLLTVQEFFIRFGVPSISKNSEANSTTIKFLWLLRDPGDRFVANLVKVELTRTFTENHASNAPRCLQRSER